MGTLSISEGVAVQTTTEDPMARIKSRPMLRSTYRREPAVERVPTKSIFKVDLDYISAADVAAVKVSEEDRGPVMRRAWVIAKAMAEVYRGLSARDLLPSALRQSWRELKLNRALNARMMAEFGVAIVEDNINFYADYFRFDGEFDSLDRFAQTVFLAEALLELGDMSRNLIAQTYADGGLARHCNCLKDYYWQAVFKTADYFVC